MSETEKSPLIERRTAFALALAGAMAMVVGSEARAAGGGVKIVVLYGHPKSPADFEKYYAEHHLPLVDKVKGIKRAEYAKVVAPPNGPQPPFYRTAELWFESPEQMQQVMSTPEAKIVVDDVPNFATGGATVMTAAIG